MYFHMQIKLWIQETFNTSFKYIQHLTVLTQQFNHKSYHVADNTNNCRASTWRRALRNAAFISIDRHTIVRFFPCYFIRFKQFIFSKIMFQLNSIAPLNSSYKVQKMETLILSFLINKLLIREKYYLIILIITIEYYFSCL